MGDNENPVPPSRARRRNMRRAIGRHNKRRRRIMRPAQQHWLRQELETRCPRCMGQRLLTKGDWGRLCDEHLTELVERKENR